MDCHFPLARPASQAERVTMGKGTASVARKRRSATCQIISQLMSSRAQSRDLACCRTQTCAPGGKTASATSRVTIRGRARLQSGRKRKKEIQAPPPRRFPLLRFSRPGRAREPHLLSSRAKRGICSTFRPPSRTQNRKQQITTDILFIAHSTGRSKPRPLAKHARRTGHPWGEIV